MEDFNTNQFILGTIFLGIFTFNSYKTPKESYTLTLTPYSNENLTTTFKYYYYYLMYFLLTWMVYYFISYFLADDSIASTIAKFFKIDTIENSFVDQLRNPLSIALLLITGVPNIPKFKNINSKILEKFWELGMIPTQVLEIMEDVGKSDFDVNEETIKRALENIPQEIVLDELELENKQTRCHEWGKIQILIDRIDTLKKENKYFVFFQNYNSIYEHIQNEKRSATALFKTYLAHNKGRQGEFNSKSARDVGVALDLQLKQAQRALLKKIYQLIVMAVLTVKNNEIDVKSELIKVGFKNYRKKGTVDDKTTQVLFVLFIMLVINGAFQFFQTFQIDGSGKTTIAIKVTIQMMFMYSFAVLIPTVFLKPKHLILLPPSHMSFDRRFVSNLLSVIFTVSLVYIFIVVYQVLWSSIILKGNDIKYEDILVYKYWPFLIQVAAMALSVRCTCNRFVHTDVINSRRTWLYDGFIVGSTVGFSGLIAAVFLYEFNLITLSGSQKFINQASNIGGGGWLFFWYFIKAFILGFVAGFISPTMYRDRRKVNNRRVMQRIFDDDYNELSDELNNFDKEEFTTLFCICMSYVSAADHQIHKFEIQQFNKDVSELIDEDIINGDLDEIYLLYQTYSKEFLRSPNMLLGNDNIDKLQKFSTFSTIKNFILLKAIEIASVDGELCLSEVEAIGKIAKKLGDKDFNIDDFLRPLTA